MIPPNNCPYKGLTAVLCWSCPHHIADTDECKLKGFAVTVANTSYTANQAITYAQSYEKRLQRYERDREELLKLSKEALVDLILHRPEL